MSEQYEPSYYEIALTGRQVLVAFVILLICLVAAFFSGVWVGRGEAGLGGPPTLAERSEGGPAETEAAGGAEDPGAGGIPAEVADGKEREELSFFEDGGAEGGDGAPGSGGAEQRRRETPEPPTPRVDPAAESEPESAPADDAAPDAPRETVNPSGALTGGDVVIQVFSSADEVKAQEILEQLHANDFRAFISPVSDGGQTFYRVRVGPFEHQEDAERVAAELRRKLDLDTWVTR